MSKSAPSSATNAWACSGLFHISGRSMASLAATFLEPDEGRVLVDGVDLRQVNLASYRSQLGLVLQNADAQLFNATVEAELAYGLERLGLDAGEIEQRLAG